MKFYVISGMALVLCVMVVLPATQSVFLRKAPSKKLMRVFYFGVALISLGILINLLMDLFC
jgi:energy-coupling factor transporter transmembrane protein EcfT